jgi:hypothetical protein
MGTVLAVYGTPVVVHRGGAETLAAGAPIAAADCIVVPDRSMTTVALFRGTRLVLDERSELTITADGPLFAFELAAGAVRADVAKLAGDEHFVIRTFDAEIEVRGTSFRVERALPYAACGGGTTTRVAVYEGLVAVRANGATALVHPGERWPSGCDAPPAPDVSSDREPPRTAPPAATPTTALGTDRSDPSARATSPSTPQAPAIEATPVTPSDLAAQNDLFAQAVARKRGGDARGAVSSFEELLARYPATHLAQSASAERMKLLQTYDVKAARAAARDYLARYPSGFARSDAEIVLGAH